MKVTNPNSDRSIIATVVHDQSDTDSLETYEIPPGESMDVEDYVVGSTLVEYGATASRAELDAARELWAEQNRQANSRTASAAASEGQILARQQATVDVATGTASSGSDPTVGELKGDALAAAVAEAKAAGLELAANASADDKRAALTAWQAQRGSSSPVDSDEFEVDANGELKLDADGNPIPVTRGTPEAEQGDTGAAPGADGSSGTE